MPKKSKYEQYTRINTAPIVEIVKLFDEHTLYTKECTVYNAVDDEGDLVNHLRLKSVFYKKVD
ncbi:hypothetical protein NVP1084O_012 [Vibrio phage 1.084.O._10N.261.49.F5]|nr:hypothetical protein NVP1084O_012 [Vibrio phage 1.084.O._10N.261.49.F5]